MKVEINSTSNDAQSRRYQCLPKPVIREGRYALTTVQDEHIQSIRRWRNAQIDVLRQRAPISPDDQHRYFENYIWPTLNQIEPKNILLSFLEDEKLIGYGGLVHIAWGDRRAEVSFLLPPQISENLAEHQRYFSYYLILIKRLAFDHLGLRRLTMETFAFRTNHIKLIEANGFQFEGCLRQHVCLKGAYCDSMIHGLLIDDK